MTTSSSRDRGGFAAMFPGLPPFDPPGSDETTKEAGLRELARTAFSPDPHAHTDVVGDNPRIPAGYTYLAQLVAHDVSFDPTPLPTTFRPASDVASHRTPRLDLDCVYGLGPAVQPHLYAQSTAPSSRGPLAPYVFSFGRASQTREGLNPGELDLPRREIQVVRLANGRARAARRVRLDGDALAAAMKVQSAPENAHLLGVMANWLSGTKHSVDETFDVIVEPAMVFELRNGPDVSQFVRLNDGYKVWARRDDSDEYAWYRVAMEYVLRLGVATIADPRNDQNALVSQVHGALAKLHNVVLQRLLAEEKAPHPRDAFVEAQRIVRWHYQWLVAHDLLDTLCDPVVVERVRKRLTDRSAPPAFPPGIVPIEFAAGAFRIGHSMTRGAYRLNDHLHDPIPLFDEHRDSLVGGRPLTNFWTLQWDRFFGDGAQRARRLDTRVARSMDVVPIDGKFESLLERDLVRGWRNRLPSGERVARALGLEPLDEAAETPLLLYVLREAEAGGGEHLGAVGSTIVAETLIGLLVNDPDSFCNAGKGWSPAKGGLVDHDDITFLDLVRVAGLPIDARSWKAFVAQA